MSLDKPWEESDELEEDGPTRKSSDGDSDDEDLDGFSIKEKGDDEFDDEDDDDDEEDDDFGSGLSDDDEEL